MAINDDLLNGFQAALGQLVTPTLTSASKTSDLFEAYILGIVLDAAVSEGAQITYRDVTGNLTSQFVFRSSPGFIFSDEQPYTYAVVDFDGCPLLEAHVGVRVAGRSDVLHECDVCVLYRSEAATCRRNRVHPRSAKVLLAVECKFYGASLPLGLARSFMGLGSDLGANHCYIVVNTTSPTVEKLLTHHDRPWEHEIQPNSTLAITRLKNAFQKVFRNFVASES